MAKLKRPNLKNCKKCGKVFVPTGPEKYCRECRQEQEELEREVANYIRDNPGVTIKEAAEATGISDVLVKRMALQGTFAMRGKKYTHTCMSCGRTITQGTYCADCLAKLRQESKRAGETMKLRAKYEEKAQQSTLDALNEKAQREFEVESSRRRRYFSQSMRDKMSRDKNRND